MSGRVTGVALRHIRLQEVSVCQAGLAVEHADGTAAQMEALCGGRQQAASVRVLPFLRTMAVLCTDVLSAVALFSGKSFLGL